MFRRENRTPERYMSSVVDIFLEASAESYWMGMDKSQPSFQGPNPVVLALELKMAVMFVKDLAEFFVRIFKRLF